MNRQFNITRSSKSIIHLTLLFFWILFSILVYVSWASIWALITGQAILLRAIAVLIGSGYGIFVALIGALQNINQFNRIRVTEEGLYVEVYVLRYIWKLVEWKDVLDIRLLPNLDRWRKPQWLLRVKKLTYWHRWISWRYSCGSEPGIIISSDVVGREELLDIIEQKMK